MYASRARVLARACPCTRTTVYLAASEQSSSPTTVHAHALAQTFQSHKARQANRNGITICSLGTINSDDSRSLYPIAPRGALVPRANIIFLCLHRVGELYSRGNSKRNDNSEISLGYLRSLRNPETWTRGRSKRGVWTPASTMVYLHYALQQRRVYTIPVHDCSFRCHRRCFPIKRCGRVHSRTRCKLMKCLRYYLG